MGEETNARRYFVSGIVQGVGYRYFAERAAKHLNVVGYARNLRDGRVEVYAIASTESHETLRRELERGPRGASVSGVTVEDAVVELTFADHFSIEYDA